MTVLDGRISQCCRFKRFECISCNAQLKAWFNVFLTIALALLLLTQQVQAASTTSAAKVENFRIVRDNDALIILVDSNWPIQFEFDTPKNGAAIWLTLKGADYYAALTRYFTSFDIDSLADCLDNLVITPVNKNEARFEADLGEGLRASFKETKSATDAYRFMLVIKAKTGTAACFAHETPPALIAEPGLFAAPAVAVTAPISMAADHELTAEEIVKEEQRRRQQQKDALKKQRSLIGQASEDEIDELFQRELKQSHYVVNAQLLADSLVVSNKGGVAGDPWLQKYGDSEIREISLAIANEQARFPFHFSARSNMQYEKDGQRVDQLKTVLDRAWVGYRLSYGLSLRAGIMYEPYFTDSSSELHALPFMERGLSNYLSPQYNPGVLLRYQGPNFGLALGGFGQRSDEPDSEQSSDVRVSYRLYSSASNFASFDAGYNKAKPINGDIAIAASPQANLIQPNMYVGAQTNIDSLTRSGFGVIWISNGITYSAQVAQLELETNNPGIVSFSSKNFWISWVSGGNGRRLDGAKWLPLRSKKSLGEIDWGFWEIAYRYSALEDNTEEHLIVKTLALNWYVNKYVTIKNNYMFATQVASPTDPNRPIDNDADLFLVRLQINI